MGMTVGWYNQMVKESESVINAQTMKYLLRIIDH